MMPQKVIIDNSENPQYDTKLPEIGSASLTEGQIAPQMEMDDEEDSYREDEHNFQCCDNCDLPDACRDFGCAIQQGLRSDVEGGGDENGKQLVRW